MLDMKYDNALAESLDFQLYTWSNNITMSLKLFMEEQFQWNTA
jgi:hypothetical protein